MLSVITVVLLFYDNDNDEVTGAVLGTGELGLNKKVPYCQLGGTLQAYWVSLNPQAILTESQTIVNQPYLESQKTQSDLNEVSSNSPSVGKN
jgi:hypothetical protein